MKTLIKLTFAFLLHFAAGLPLSAQTLEWTKPVPLKEKQQCYTMCASDDKGFWLGGFTHEKAYIYNSNIFPKMIVMAVDSLGDTLWQQNFFDRYKIGIITNIFPAPEGKYLVGRYSHDTIITTGIPNPRYKPLVMYTDANGNIIWSYDNLVPECTDLSVRDAIVMENGDIVLVGVYMYNNPLYNCSLRQYGFAMRITQDGVILWNQQYSPTGVRTSLYSIGRLPNGHLLFMGYNENTAFMNIEVDEQTGVLLKSSIVQLPVTNLSVYLTARLTLLSDGSFIAAGDYQTTSGSNYGFMARLDANLNALWVKTNMPLNRHAKVFEMLNGFFLAESYASGNVLTMSKRTIATGDAVWAVPVGSQLLYDSNFLPYRGRGV